MDCKSIPIYDLELDLDNPRIKHYIQIYQGELTSEALSLALSGGSGSLDSYKALKESIRTYKGIINPIIVNKDSSGRQVVLEGNTRLQIYREFYEKEPEGPWGKIPCIIYEGLSSEEIHSIRLQIHLVGPRDWEPFSKAKYLYQLSREEMLPMNTIISYCGGKSSEINNYIDAYETMKDFYMPEVEKLGLEPETNQFSKFAELEKNKNATNALYVHKYTKSDFARWVINDNIDTAQNVRVLPAVLNNPEARRIFLKSNITEAKKCLVSPVSKKDLSGATTNELVEELLSRFRSIEYKEVVALAQDHLKQTEYDNIECLSDEVQNLLKCIEEYKED